jgi:hypothetical protein
MKRALDLHGNIHRDILYIEEGVAAGWRKVRFASGNLQRMSTTELAKIHGVNPFANVNPIDYNS